MNPHDILLTLYKSNVPINPGNSGGPLFNKNRELIGVNTFTQKVKN